MYMYVRVLRTEGLLERQDLAVDPTIKRTMASHPLQFMLQFTAARGQLITSKLIIKRGYVSLYFLSK